MVLKVCISPQARSSLLGDLIIPRHAQAKDKASQGAGTLSYLSVEDWQQLSRVSLPSFGIAVHGSLG